MNKRKIIIMLVCICMTAACFTGCSSKLGDISLDAGETGIYIDGEKVSYGIKEDFGESYYDKDDLKSAIDDEVTEFNEKYGESEDGMSVSTYKVKSKEVYVVFEFASYSDFVSYIVNYNNVSEEDIFLGTVDEAAQKFSIDASFVSAENGEEVSAADIMENNNYNILIVNESIKVEINGNAVSMSDNCIAEDNIITTPADETGYIIFK